MTAQILDGTATAKAIKGELTERVAKLREQGVMPGLGTVLVGDDPGSTWYVNGKHKDCAEVGIESLREDLPGTATQEEILAAVRRLNDNPACTGYIVQLPLPKGIDENAVLGRDRPGQGRRRAAPDQPRLAGARQGGAAAVHAVRHRGAAAPARRGDPGADVIVVGRGVTVGRPLGLLLTRRSENATVTLCHTGTRDLAAHVRQRRHRRRGGRRARHHHRRDGQARRGRARRRRLPRRRQAGRRRRPSVYDVAGWVSPNPGGVGPMTRAMLLSNVVAAAEASLGTASGTAPARDDADEARRIPRRWAAWSTWSWSRPARWAWWSWRSGRGARASASSASRCSSAR